MVERSAELEMTVQNTSPGMDLNDMSTAELERSGVIVTRADFLYNWARGNSVWPLTFGLACCAIEMIAAAILHVDLFRGTILSIDGRITGEMLVDF